MIKKIVLVSDKIENLKVCESTLMQEDTSSCSKLLYKKFNKKFEFPKALKLLITIIDDYNSYNLKLSESKIMNALYRRSGSRRFYNFVNNFWNGFEQFSDSELKISETFYRDLQTELENLDLYKGTYRGFSIIATFSSFSASEIASALLDCYNPDVVIVVNTDTKFVSFRKKPESKADIVFMAQNLCNGGGGEFSSGGQLTSKFLELTTQLSPL